MSNFVTQIRTAFRSELQSFFGGQFASENVPRTPRAKTPVRKRTVARAKTNVKNASAPRVEGGTLVEQVRGILSQGVAMNLGDISAKLSEPQSRIRTAIDSLRKKNELKTAGRGMYLLKTGRVPAKNAAPVAHPN